MRLQYPEVHKVYVLKYQEMFVFKIVPIDRCSPNLEFATRASYFYENEVARMAMYSTLKLKKNFMVWVRERTIPTERPPLVGEVIANFLRIDGATWPAWRIPTAVFSVF
jgi:hypothetical protein